MVTAATTASSVSPPALRMSMPLPMALTPLALEMISGRLPLPAGASGLAPLPASLPFALTAPKSLPVPAMALPASEVRKNLRRDHRSMMSASLGGAHYMAETRERKPLADLGNVSRGTNHHSYLRATIGSTRMARRAGT